LSVRLSVLHFRSVCDLRWFAEVLPARSA
jgi:hypothetical protein